MSWQCTNNASVLEQHTHAPANGCLQSAGTAPENDSVGLESWKCSRSLRCAASQQSSDSHASLLSVSADLQKLHKSFPLVNVLVFVVLPFTLYPLTDLDIVCNLLHRKATGFWRRATSDWPQSVEKKARILLTTVHRAGMTVAQR